MRKRVAAVGGGVALAAALVGGGVAAAGVFEPGEDGSHDYTQEEADRAERAALDATGGGTANEVERDDENGATWEVEVTQPDGTTVDVRLDENYELVTIEDDAEDTDDADD